MNKRNPVTPFGWEIKQKLVEIQMDQRTFCDTYHIPASRLSNLIHGTRKVKNIEYKYLNCLGSKNNPLSPLWIQDILMICKLQWQRTPGFFNIECT